MLCGLQGAVFGPSSPSWLHTKRLSNQANSQPPLFVMSAAGPVTPAQLAEVESICKEFLAAKAPVYAQVRCAVCGVRPGGHIGLGAEAVQCRGHWAERGRGAV